ncbi:MAG TPA: patatin-like phospholipase family protein [Puia sp.]|nr:patatin-like phospholipase family protein [Puia sp.]
MIRYLKAFYYSFPIQLVILHIKKFQVLLFFWYILFSTVNAGFMESFGAYALFLAPEYLGKVNSISAGVVGAATGVFIMSWNITTFILFSRHFRFLATTTKPFLKYCINNSIIPLLFLIFYFVKALQFEVIKELVGGFEFFFLTLGFLVGLAIIIIASLLYFFRADKTIIRQITPVMSNAKLFKSQFAFDKHKVNASRLMKVKWYLNSPFSVKKARDVSHYSREFIENIFGRHHFSAILSIFVAFIFLIIVGFFMDNPLFQLPAAASILIFFTILISISGAFSYFLQSWSIPFVIGLFLVLNLLYHFNVIDPTNKAYGLNYLNRLDRPSYDRETLLRLCTAAKVEHDKENMLQILEKWKRKQKEQRPVFYIINTSGGGNRSATFTMNVLQYLDSISNHELMRKTFLISGASGGMIGAAYFRELANLRENKNQSIDLQSHKYADNISRDLLNPLFSSFVARDLASPAQKFKVGDYEYIKDRGYAFEQKLAANTHGLLDKQLKDIYADEKNARIPLMFFNSVITRDSRSLVISTQPVSFLMRPEYDSTRFPTMDPDAVDFASFFAKQNPMNLRLLTALRMNATFPYVLPNVWLPTTPVIDVMDAGFRDNFGEQTAVRFLYAFRDWLKENTSSVIMIQISDRKSGGWENPYESNDITEIITKPLLLLQHNWYKMQEYNQNDLLSLSQQTMGKNFYKLSFQYVPTHENQGATLNFHLTKQEKLDIANALSNSDNQENFKRFKELSK